MNPVTWASMANCSSTSVSAATTCSLARVAVLCAGPVRSTSRLGRAYGVRFGSVSWRATGFLAVAPMTTVSLRAGCPSGASGSSAAHSSTRSSEATGSST